MANIKVGIIGTGGMANTHARRYREIRGVDLRSCYDIDTKRAADFALQHKIDHVASSLEEVIEVCDATSVVTPDAHHAPLSLRILKAGKHLLCEKPLATTLKDARRVARGAIQAAQQHGAIHMINLSYRDSSAVQEAIKIVARGELGEIRHVHGHYLQSWLAGTTSWGHWQDPNWLWRLQTAQGSMGVLGDLGCHLLDLLTAVAGDVDTVESRLTTFPKVDRKGTQRTTLGATRLDANDTATIQLEFANGAVGVCHTTRWATGHMNSIFLGVHGTDGALRIDLDQGKDKLQLCRGRNKAVGRWSTRTIRTTPSIYQRFIRSIQTRRQDQPDVPRGAQIQSLLDACQRSSQQNGKPTRVRKWV